MNMTQREPRTLLHKYEITIQYIDKITNQPLLHLLRPALLECEVFVGDKDDLYYDACARFNCLYLLTMR